MQWENEYKDESKKNEMDNETCLSQIIKDGLKMQPAWWPVCHNDKLFFATYHNYFQASIPFDQDRISSQSKWQERTTFGDCSSICFQHLPPFPMYWAIRSCGSTDYHLPLNEYSELQETTQNPLIYPWFTALPEGARKSLIYPRFTELPETAEKTQTHSGFTELSEAA